MVFTTDQLNPRSEAQIIWRCRGDRLEILVFAGDLLDRDYGQAIFWRVDRGQVQTIQGSRSTTGRALFVPSGAHKRFTESLLTGKEVVIRLGLLELESYTYRFSVVGLKDALSNLKCYK